jgi:hypothetical protein
VRTSARTSEQSDSLFDVTCEGTDVVAAYDLLLRLAQPAYDSRLPGPSVRSGPTQ